MTILEAIIIAIVEGITEFLPVSSTGHMIITSSLLGIHKEEFTKLFEVAIQLGAILAVVILYWKKFFTPTPGQRWHFYMKLFIGVLPALALGLFFSDEIDAMLESPVTVAVSLLAGGILLLFIENLFKEHPIATEQQITYRRAFVTGLWQTVAMIPGVSRSAASILGGMQQKFTRNLAAEFSFFLAVPTMFAATIYALFFKDWQSGKKGFEMIIDNRHNAIAFVVGNLVAFVVAVLAIRFFISYLKKHGFMLFGWYRIIVGIVLLILMMTGVIER